MSVGVAAAHRLQAAAVAPLMGLFQALPPVRASATGGALAQALGPLTGLHRRAAENLSRALPDLSPAARAALLPRIWDNLGRTMGEYAHLADYWRLGRVELTGAEYLRAMARSRAPALLFSGHLANWELLPAGLPRFGLDLAIVYRAPNNPVIDRMLAQARALPRTRYLPKGAQGARAILATLQAGGKVAMLVDQRMNDGIQVPFFGRPAMTAPALAQLARRFGCPVYPVRKRRLGGARVAIEIHDPWEVPRSADREADILAFMTRVNAALEGWIRETPADWLWVHRRWGKEAERPGRPGTA